MPVTALDPNPTINVIFRGLIVAHVEDGEREGQVGAIHEADLVCHSPKIRVIKSKPGTTDRDVATEDDFDLTQDIFLDVENTDFTSVQTFNVAGFDRSDPGENNKHDFRLFLSLENDVHKGESIPSGIVRDKIVPVFHIQNAVFYTFLRSQSKIDFIPRTGGALIEFNAFVAQQIAAQIVLSKPTSRALLRSGDKVIRTFDARDVTEGATYTIEFDCECSDERQRPAITLFGKDASDFLFCYRVLATTLTPDRQRDIRGQKFNNGTGGGPQSPEVICTGPRTTGSLR